MTNDSKSKVSAKVRESSSSSHFSPLRFFSQLRTFPWHLWFQTKHAACNTNFKQQGSSFTYYWIIVRRAVPSEERCQTTVNLLYCQLLSPIPEVYATCLDWKSSSCSNLFNLCSIFLLLQNSRHLILAWRLKPSVVNRGLNMLFLNQLKMFLF